MTVSFEIKYKKGGSYLTKVIKRDCESVDFDKLKIYKVIMKAMTNGSSIVKSKIAEEIAEEIYIECEDKDEVGISDIECMVSGETYYKKAEISRQSV